MNDHNWKIYNSPGSSRVVVTKALPGERWLQTLIEAGCRVKVCRSSAVLSSQEIVAAFGRRCDGAIGQLTEVWGEELFVALKKAGGRVYSNYAVGFNNVDVAAASRQGIPVGNTPGVLTEATAEMAVALTFAAARRIGESERFLRAGRYHGWLPDLFLGDLLRCKTAGAVGAGRIGEAYARMMLEGHRMNILYFDIARNEKLESDATAFGEFLQKRGENPPWCRRVETLEELLSAADVVSLHTVLDESTSHLIDADRLSTMKTDAILVNTSRGPVIDENALVAHCKANPNFRAALDVFEDEPALAPGLDQLENVILVPHIASATRWTREGMAQLAACNVAAILKGDPVWALPDIRPFLGKTPPRAAPSIVNAAELSLPGFER